jgi:hypothetical protein
MSKMQRRARLPAWQRRKSHITVSVSVGNVTITIGATTKPISDSSLKTATTGVTIVDGNKLKISNLKVALVAGNKITVKAGTLTDRVLNKNLAVEVTLEAD